MKPYDYIGYRLSQSTAVSAIVGTRVNHGNRPSGTVTPCINYYEVFGNRFYGMESPTFSINCRSTDPGQARDLAREVVTLFAGDSGQGVYGVEYGFTIARASLVNDNGIIPEPTDNIYNAPVDVQIVYAITTVS